MRNLNLHNEKIYSGKNTALKKDAARIIQVNQLRFYHDQIIEKEKNKEAIKYYKDFLLKVRELIDFLKIGKTDLEKALVVEYLLHNGTLSNKKILVGKRLNYNEGVNVIENEEDSFNISKFYFDLFKDLYDYPITYPCYNSNKEDSFKVRNADDNYAINLCTHNGILYGVDLLKENIYTFKDEFTLELISNYFENYLRYKPYLAILTNPNITINDIQTYLDLFKNNVNDDSITPKECAILRNKIYGLMEEKGSIIRSFEHDTQEMKQEIHKMLSKTR